MKRTRVKICGITRLEHARAAAEAGGDAIGLVFYRESPRYLSIRDAAAIAESLPPFVAAVGLFVNASERDIRAVRMEPGTDLLEYADRFSRAKALLLDAHVPGQPGGTGRTFDWAGIPRDLP